MRFGPFEIVRPLGRGGMAETFVARRPGHDGFARDICLKRVLPERAAEPDFVSGFQREAKLAARLVHPHIAQVYDFGCEGETWWMTLEHVPGGDLRALLKSLGQPMPADLGLVLMVDMLEALGYAHDLGIVHRDVSPSNILLDLQGNFKLADFGIAKVRHVDRDGTTAYSTTTGTIKGKAAYMAPEQALGLEVDGRADLWSFGVVMFEAFSGKKPFEGATDLAIMMAANQGQRARVSQVAPHLPPDVAAVIEKLLTPQRDGRFQSAGDVLEALSNHPAPVRGRRVIAAMLQSIGAATAATAQAVDAAPATTIEAAPSFTSEEAIVAPSVPPTTSSSVRPAALASVPPAAPAPSAPATPSAPASTQPAAPQVTEIATTRPTRPAASTGASAARGAAIVFSLAAVAGLAVAIGFVMLQPLGSTDPPTLLAEPRPASTVGTTPRVAVGALPHTTPTRVRTIEPPIARGVSVPTEDELPSVPGPTSAGSPPTPRSGAGSRTTPPPERGGSRVESGSLHVTVIPWGDVRVDGTAHGRSPVTVDLAPGTHRVRIESESGTVTREVSITAGRREELEVDLSDG